MLSDCHSGYFLNYFLLWLLNVNCMCTMTNMTINFTVRLYVEILIVLLYEVPRIPLMTRLRTDNLVCGDGWIGDLVLW